MSYGEIPTTEIPYTGGRNIPAVNVVESTMSTFLHEKTIEYLKLLFSSQYQRENLCDTIRQHMTYSFGPLWHVIMVEDRQFTYEFAKSSHDHLVVHIGKHIFIIWRQILEDVFPASLFLLTPCLVAKWLLFWEHVHEEVVPLCSLFPRCRIVRLLLFLQEGWVWSDIIQVFCSIALSASSCSPYFGCTKHDYSQYEDCKKALQYIYYGILTCFLSSALLRRYQVSVKKNKGKTIYTVIDECIKRNTSDN